MKSHWMKYLAAGAALTAALSFSALAADVKGGTVETSSAVNVRSTASTAGDVINKLYDGTKICVIDTAADGWYQIAVDGAVGYVSADYISLSNVMNVEPGGAKVTTEVLNMRSEPSTQASVVTRLTQGNVAKIIGINNGWLKVSYNSNTGYISPDYVEFVADTQAGSKNSNGADSTTGSGKGSDIITYARTFLGVKYVYGGSSPKGFDCSGFTKYVFSHFGISLTHSASAQYNTNVSKISKSELRTGDLVFFGNGGSRITHVGIYIGNGDFIHASSPGDVVKIDTINKGYYNRNYIGAGRVL